MLGSSDKQRAGAWEFWIDRGGTFTDCIGRAPDGALHTAKLLSSEMAPLQAMRKILEEVGTIEPGAAAAETPLPASRVKLGTTVATNALLERRGVPMVVVTNAGFGDLFEIGTQERPEIFALRIERPPVLQREAIEVVGRLDAEGREIEPLDLVAAEQALRRARIAGAEAVAIVLLHAYRNPEPERALARLARELGFPYVTASHAVASEIGFLARGETTLVDAYLTPLLQRHVERLREALPGSVLRFMQSSGGLTDGARFRGPFALLSGPAGGVVGASKVAEQAGYARAIGFDMGGTSTDVSLVEEDGVAKRFESVVGGVRVKAPMLAIHTVAAGGGSLCRFDGYRLSVGPESAGAEPGPLCYGRLAEDGGGAASELALTDVNLFLGRIQADHFPFELEHAPVAAKLERLREELARVGQDMSAEQIAAGFVEIANKSMAQAIARVSVARGVDPRDYVLVGFGGAAGQHVTAVARELGMREILLHPLAGLLSAYGIGLADESWDGARDAGRIELGSGTLPEAVCEQLAELREEGRTSLLAEGYASEQVLTECSLDLRYVGTESALVITAPEGDEPTGESYRAAFEAKHMSQFGYLREGRPLEIVTTRVRVCVPAESPEMPTFPSDAGAAPSPLRTENVWFPGLGRVAAPVYERLQFCEGHELEGPALILDEAGTLLLDPGFRAEVIAGGVLRLIDLEPGGSSREGAAREGGPSQARKLDPIRLEVFSNRFASIGEQMGSVLRNTAVSTNIKERLDYSCAVFDGQGGLVANAPHIPVHLGAMSETVRAVLARFPALAAGDVIATNDPRCGGSHLPDITTISPVFLPDRDEAPAFFVASRGHHADIGGIRPGSMPANSATLSEEGIVLTPFKLVEAGYFAEEELRRRLSEAPYPARNPSDNIADLEAMLAANRAGERLLLEWVKEVGAETVELSMRELQETAAAKVAAVLEAFPDGRFHFEDALDDGSVIRVALEIRGGRMRIDFAGTAAASAGNLNAPRAVVHAAVIYVLRALVDEPIPLNGGCLAPVEIYIPEGSLLDPPPDAAVVGGNVETSQRIVDVLLGALGVVAASQGTMNNVTFGDARFGYYETLGGGTGAGNGFAGASGVHSHMTNTRITDPEVLETRYPVRLEEFSLRRGSGGAGHWNGGDGLLRRYRFLVPVELSLLSERRTRAPYGMAGGGPGARGRNLLIHPDGRREELPGAVNLSLAAGSRLQVETPGGGGFGEPGQAPGTKEKDPAPKD